MLAKETLKTTQHSFGTNYQKAISQFEEVSDAFEQLGDTPEASVAEIWATQLLPDIGTIEESRRRLATVITNAERSRFRVLLPAGNYWLAIAESKQHNFSESIKLMKIALRSAEAAENVFEVQHAQDNLTVLYMDFGDLNSALLFGSSLVFDRNLYYQNPSQYWREKGTLSDISLRLGFISTAFSLSKEILDIFYDTSPDNRLRPASSMFTDTLDNMIAALAAKEDIDLALKYANDSMQIALKREDTEERTRTAADISLLLADLKSRAKDFNGALADYDKALELNLELPEVTNSLYKIHKGKLFCFQQLNRQSDFSNELETVLKLSEEYRTTIREDDSRQAFFANEQDVFDMAAANALTNADSRKAFELIEESKARSLLDFVESDKSIAEVEKGFGAVAKPLSLSDIQSRLPDQVQIVQYAVLPDRLAIWTISRSRFDLVEKQISADELEKKINAYQDLIVDKGSPEETRRAGQELYQLLIPDILAGEKQLCVIPDKSLHRLSFASLISRRGKFLIEDYALFYAPSSSVLVIATQSASLKAKVENESLLSIGNPDFDREENPNLPNLQDAETEAKDIANDYPRSLELIGDKATKDKFLDALDKFEVVHFAGHFVANRRSPGNSKLLFAGGELRSNQLSAYKLSKTKLVVMSACETGFERYNKSEGAIGIARTLLAMGAPVVVASQWKVDSVPTKDLMIAFHRNRKQKGMTSAESLRRAQLDMLSRENTKAPFYWAAFSMFGGYASY